MNLCLDVVFQCAHVYRVVECRAPGQGDRGSKPPAAVSKFGQFRSPHFDCLCLSEETLKTVSPFYLVSMSGEIKDPTQRNGNKLEDSMRLT